MKLLVEATSIAVGLTVGLIMGFVLSLLLISVSSVLCLETNLIDNGHVVFACSLLMSFTAFVVILWCRRIARKYVIGRQ